MKYFLDTEFIETVGNIDLISIGIVCEDGRELYFVNVDAKIGKASEWVRDNVLKPMPEYHALYPIEFHIETEALHSPAWIREEVLKFVIGDNIEFYGYFADYDWVVFCWLFGTMMDLPKGFPMYCMDLKQMMKERGLTKEWKQINCPDPEGEHNALVDAKWNFNLYKAIIQSPNVSGWSDEDMWEMYNSVSPIFDQEVKKMAFESWLKNYKNDKRKQD